MPHQTGQYRARILEIKIFCIFGKMAPYKLFYASYLSLATLLALLPTHFFTGMV